MSVTDVTLHEVIRILQTEHLIGADGTDYMHGQHTQQPWYIRAMVGFGAWLASLLLIGFVAGFSLAMDGGYVVIGGTGRPPLVRHAVSVWSFPAAAGVLFGREAIKTYRSMVDRLSERFLARRTKRHVPFICHNQ